MQAVYELSLLSQLHQSGVRLSSMAVLAETSTGVYFAQPCNYNTLHCCALLLHLNEYSCVKTKAPAGVVVAHPSSHA